MTRATFPSWSEAGLFRLGPVWWDLCLGPGAQPKPCPRPARIRPAGAGRAGTGHRARRPPARPRNAW